jgi:hypothetical protein
MGDNCTGKRDCPCWLCQSHRDYEEQKKLEDEARRLAEIDKKREEERKKEAEKKK